jgi:dipeptidyl-peptidase-4
MVFMKITKNRGVFGLLLGLMLLGSGGVGRAQSRFRSTPDYERYARFRKEGPGSWKSGAVRGRWLDAGGAFEFERDGKRWRFQAADGKVVEADGPTAGRAAAERGKDHAERAREWSGRPERGRQFPAATSPDGSMVAYHRDRNLYLGNSAGGGGEAITTEGNDRNRLRFGSASWVYGEELFQKAAIWWSADSRRIAFYRFDESKVPDYYLTRDHTLRQTTLETEPYPKAGAPNPVADLLIYDRETHSLATVDVRSGAPFSDGVVGHYVFAVQWSPDGRELLFHRMDRRQKIIELCAADPVSGAVRVVWREERPGSWVDFELASLRFLADGQSFLRESDRSGWRNLVRHSLAGAPAVEITKHAFETAGIIRIDEPGNSIWYLARSGDNHMKVQLHRCSLDGSGDTRLTDPTWHHEVSIAPDGRHFADIAQRHNHPPVTRIMRHDGSVAAELARSDLSGWHALGGRSVEMVTFKAADAVTDLHGLLHLPSGFDPSRRWPLLVSVYAGPATNAARETFSLPAAATEAGWIVATLDSRSAAGRGRAFLDAIYQKLGQAEVDDQAAGIKALSSRTYVDASRVGIHGTSYGGTVSAMALLRHPEIFKAACTSSGVMDFRNYDSIYTERYLGLPSDSGAAYDAASPLGLAPTLSGRLMIFFGTADNNVHPANSLQLIQALQQNGKSFDLQIGPDQGHVSIGEERLLEFFSDALGAGPR